MTVLYKLAREQLSKASHYDFGLRALKAVLVMAGALKRASPHMPEALVLMRALRDMNLPKFVYDDVPLFLGLIRDLFPGERLLILPHGSCDHCIVPVKHPLRTRAHFQWWQNEYHHCQPSFLCPRDELPSIPRPCTEGFLQAWPARACAPMCLKSQMLPRLSCGNAACKCSTSRSTRSCSCMRCAATIAYQPSVHDSMKRCKRFRCQIED